MTFNYKSISRLDPITYKVTVEMDEERWNAEVKLHGKPKLHIVTINTIGHFLYKKTGVKNSYKPLINHDITDGMEKGIKTIELIFTDTPIKYD